MIRFSEVWRQTPIDSEMRILCVYDVMYFELVEIRLVPADAFKRTIQMHFYT